MSRRDYQVIVVGGGPAGSAAAIHLAARGLRVLLLEKSVMPREKLCGEFLSTEVASMCRNLGILEELLEAGARRVLRLDLTEPKGRAVSVTLPGPALSLSRSTFDHVLFARADKSGADAFEGEAVGSVTGSLEEGFCVETARRRVTGDVVLGAYGRRGILDRRLGRASLMCRSPYMGFKIRHAGRSLPETVELHVFSGGYCGLVGDEKGTVNVCWLSHAGNLKHAGGSPEAMIHQKLLENPHLRRRLEGLSPVGAFQAVSQLSFRSKELFPSDVCMIGDAAGMIAPLCGDGIGMALRSAEISARLVDRFLTGRLSPKTFRSSYRSAWHREFSLRMRLGRWLNDALTHPSASRLVITFAGITPGVTRAAISATRG